MLGGGIKVERLRDDRGLEGRREERKREERVVDGEGKGSGNWE